MVITEQQFRNAVQIIKMYSEQKYNKPNTMRLGEFINKLIDVNEYKEDFSHINLHGLVRLINSLKAYGQDVGFDIDVISLRRNDVKKLRNLGDCSWNLFSQLRREFTSCN
jgi:hypothetical protein